MRDKSCWGRQLMLDYQEFDSPWIITRARLQQGCILHALHGPATGKVRRNVTHNNGWVRMATPPMTIVPGIGRNLLSSGAAQSKGGTTTTSYSTSSG